MNHTNEESAMRYEMAPGKHFPYSNDMWPGNKRGNPVTDRGPYTPLPVRRQACSYEFDIPTGRVRTGERGT